MILLVLRMKVASALEGLIHFHLEFFHNMSGRQDTFRIIIGIGISYGNIILRVIDLNLMNIFHSNFFFIKDGLFRKISQL